MSYTDVEFVVSCKKVEFRTGVNGDTLVLAGIHLTPDQAAALAYILNVPGNLHVEIKSEGL